MGLKKVTAGSITYLSPKTMKKGDTVEGTFVETRNDSFGNPAHKIRTAEGNVVINGTGQLDSLMSNIQVGTLVRIVYQGKAKLKSGKYKGTEAHAFDVFADDGANAIGSDASDAEL